MINDTVSFEVPFSLMPLKSSLILLCFFRKGKPHYKLSIWSFASIIIFCLGNYVRYDIFFHSNATPFSGNSNVNISLKAPSHKNTLALFPYSYLEKASFSTEFIDSIQSQSKSQQVIVWISTNQVLHERTTKTQNSQHDTEEQQSWKQTLPDFKADYEATIIKTV